MPLLLQTHNGHIHQSMHKSPLKRPIRLCKQRAFILFVHTCKYVCVHLYVFMCICMCAFNPTPLGVPGAFYPRKISQMLLKSNIHEPFHYNCSLSVWSSGICRIPGISFLYFPHKTLPFAPPNPHAPPQLRWKTITTKNNHSNADATSSPLQVRSNPLN